MHRELIISCETPEAASVKKDALRLAGIHAWIESTDTSSWAAYKATATRVVVADHYPEVGPIEPLLARVLS